LELGARPVELLAWFMTEALADACKYAWT